LFEVYTFKNSQKIAISSDTFSTLFQQKKTFKALREITDPAAQTNQADRLKIVVEHSSLLGFNIFKCKSLLFDIYIYTMKLANKPIMVENGI
jgi:hypothetical protein